MINLKGNMIDNITKVKSFRNYTSDLINEHNEQGGNEVYSQLDKIMKDNASN